ncbi:MAG: sugar ABC transporter substrate-binding protein [Planctomycetaceae bacterium]|nr:sugar ABC transporter substrate-binding protein [Planctomycetaceae bacterium]
MRKMTMLALAGLLVLTSFAQAGERYKIALVCKAMDSEFWQDVRNGGQAAADKAGNIDLVVMAPDREVNVQQQVQLVEDLIIQGVDGIAIAPCGAQELMPVMDNATDEGIPVILVDTDAPWDRKIAYVGTNNYAGGKMAGEFIAKDLNGKGTVALITGIMGHQTHIDRVTGCEDVFKDYPGIKVVAKQPANSERALAMTTMENILTSNPDLDYVFVTNSPMTLGTYEAVQADKSDCKIIGFDADTEIFPHIRDGGITGIIAQGPYDMGRLGVESVAKVLAGESISKVVDVPTVLITKDNVAEYIK